MITVYNGRTHTDKQLMNAYLADVEKYLGVLETTDDEHLLDDAHSYIDMYKELILELRIRIRSEKERKV